MDKQALFQLVSSGDYDTLRTLIQTHSIGGSDLDVVNNQGHSLISIAAAEGREDIVKLLIDSGVQFGRNGDFRPLGSDWDPLHLAARRCRLSVVKLLTESGADINAKDYKENTVLANGLIGGDLTIATYLNIFKFLLQLHSVDIGSLWRRERKSTQLSISTSSLSTGQSTH